MKRYRLRIFLWVGSISTALLIGAIFILLRLYEEAGFQSYEATAYIYTQNAPTNTKTPLFTSTPTRTATITFTPTNTLTPTRTLTPAPCALSLPNSTTIYEFPSFVNFRHNTSLEAGNTVALFRLKDEPWWFVRSGEKEGWVLIQKNVVPGCPNLQEYGLESIQANKQSWPVIFEDTFEFQSNDWKIVGDTPKWIPSSLIDKQGSVVTDALTLGYRMTLFSQDSNTQIRLDKKIDKPEWDLMTSFQYAALSENSYFGIRIYSTTQDEHILEFRVYPLSCKYAVYSLSGEKQSKLEKEGVLQAEACKSGMEFKEGDNPVAVPYGFLNLTVTNQPQKNSVKFLLSFNGFPGGLEISTPGENYHEVTLGLVSARMRSYLDYFVITGQ